jgi:autotransporter-associated beta strand protein
MPATGYGTSGINLNLTANQKNSVTIISQIALTTQIGFFGLNLDSGAGALTFGDSTANQLLLTCRPAGSSHSLVNNSANPVTFNSSVQWQAGGGTAFTLDFSGSGNWLITNNLRGDNNMSGPVTVQLDGPGTMYWSAGYLNNFNSPIGNITINGGTMILGSAGLMPISSSYVILNNGNFLQYNAGAPDTWIGTVAGSSPLIVSSGALTLSGANVYTGTTVLTNTGTVIVNSAENLGSSGPLGVGGTIAFGGGTLQFGVNNTYDYSPRFSTAANQAYNFNTAGLPVTFTNGLTSSGGSLTETGPGTLTLAGANTYGGTTTVTGSGKVVFQGTMTGTGAITVADGAALGVTTTGTQLQPGTLTLGTSAGATLEFNNLTSTATPPIAAGTLSSAGTLTVNINSGTFSVGQSYPLLAWTSGSAPTVNLVILNGFVGNTSVSGNTLILNITATAYKWTGLANANWDTSTANNWVQNGGPVVFANGFPTLFDDTATGTPNVTLNSVVLPSSLSVNNSLLAYSFTSSSGDDIGGATGLTKNGTNTLTLSGGFNAYSGATTILNGMVSVGALANGGSASDIGAANNSASNLALNGGTLQYTGAGASSDRLFTIGASGATIDGSGSGALNLNNSGLVAYSGTGLHGLLLTGTSAATNTLAAVLGDYGGKTSLTVSGSTAWVLTGNNTNSGVTTIEGGMLQIGTGGANGRIGSGNITDDASLVFDTSANQTIGVVSGTGSLIQQGSGTLVLPGNNTYQGGTAINAGTLQVGTGGTTGSLNANGNITNNGALVFNSTGSHTLNAGVIISGTGTLTKQGSGLLQLLGTCNFTGGATVASNAYLQVVSGNQGSFASPITNYGKLLFVRQDNGGFIYSNTISGTGMVLKDGNNDNYGDITFVGTNTYTGGTFICLGAVILGDGVTPGIGSIVGNVVFTNSLVTAYDIGRALTFNRPDNFTFTNFISGSGSTNAGNQGGVVQNGTGTVTLTANNTYYGRTTVSNGTLQVGAGGTSGWIGTSTNGAIIYGTLVFDRSDNVTYSNAISGTGTNVQIGSGTLKLAGANTYTGATTISNGTLVVTNVAGEMDVYGGVLNPGGDPTINTLTVAGDLDMNAGTIVVYVNKALSPAQSNTIIQVSGSINITNGTLKFVNLGPSIAAGDVFDIFNGVPVSTLSALTIVAPGFTLSTNDMATSGSVTVATAAAAGSEIITASVSGGQIHLSWPAIWTGVHLQMQTDSLSAGIGTSWVTVAGSDAANTYSAPLNQTGAVFYRLAP